MVRSPLRCHYCDDVVGMYEPVIVQSGGSFRETSRAAEPDLQRLGAAHYHQACHALRFERSPQANAGAG